MLILPGLCLVIFHGDKGPFFLGTGLGSYDYIKQIQYQ